MTVFNDLDLGPSHAWLKTRIGQVVGTTHIEGSRTIIWPRGRTVEEQPVDLYVAPWQAIGGAAASSRQALLYLLRQLEELAGNPDLQPVYIQWTTTAAPGAYSAAEAHDGWYVVNLAQPPYRRYVVTGGTITVPVTVTMVAPAAPASLAAWLSGAALSSGYSAAATALVSYPVGSTQQPPTAASRTGGEGIIPISTSPVPNPVPFVRPGTIAALFTGGCRVWDTINTASNPVPVAGGTFVNANWVEVKGTQHDFAGDYVVTNGLVLLLYQAGQPNVPRVYLWNTSLATATWQLIGDVKYNDNAANAGTLREINLERVGLQEVRIRCTVSTSAGNYATFRHKLVAGSYHVFLEFVAQTESETSQTNLLWDTTAGIGAYATGFTDSTSSTVFPSNLATTTVSGYAAAQGSAAGSPIFGFLFQNIPTTAQGRLVSTTQFALGDTVGPTQGATKLYGFFVVPYAGTVVLATAQATVAPLFQQYKFDRTVSWVRG